MKDEDEECAVVDERDETSEMSERGRACEVMMMIPSAGACSRCFRAVGSSSPSGEIGPQRTGPCTRSLARHAVIFPASPAHHTRFSTRLSGCVACIASRFCSPVRQPDDRPSAWTQNPTSHPADPSSLKTSPSACPSPATRPSPNRKGKRTMR